MREDSGPNVRKILKRLNGSSDSIEASAVMSKDGMSVASVLGDGVDPDRLGAMCASLLSLGNRTAHELDRGDLQQVLIHGKEGYLLVTNIGDDAVLAVVSRPSSKLGMVFIEARKAAAQIANFIT